MSILRFKEDRMNVFRAITAPFIFYYPFIFGFSGSEAWLMMLFLWILLNDINHVLHLHIHLPFTSNKFINLILDLCMGFVTGMTASNWRIQHVHGHHQAVEREYAKGYRWEMDKFSILGSLSYSIRTAPLIFLRPLFEASRKSVHSNQTGPMNYRWAFIEQILFIGMVVVLFVWQPLLTLGYLLPWYFLVYFVTRYIDYLNHFGCGTGDYDNANNCLHRVYNLLGNNFGYHTAHHLSPKAHWTRLPIIHENIKDMIPEEFKKDYSWSGFMLPYHFLLALKKKM